MSLELTYAPRNRIKDYLLDGWRLIPSHDYRKSDWAILLEKGVCDQNPDDVVKRFATPIRVKSAECPVEAKPAPKPQHKPRMNVVLAAVSRNEARYSISKQLIHVDEIIEKNTQLEKRIAEIVGHSDVVASVHLFKLTPREAKVFALIMNRGIAEQGLLQSTAMNDDALIESDSPERVIRDVMKRIRKKIRPFGLDFTTIYGMEYGMEDDTRRRAKKLIADYWKRDMPSE